MLELATHRPRPPLDRFVELVTFYRGYQPRHTREKILPDGAVEIIVDLTDWPKRLYDRADPRRHRAFRRSWISGMRREYIVIGADADSSMAVIRFRPGGAYPFLRFPLVELTDTVVELDRVLGSRAGELRQRVLDADTPDAKFAAVERWLLELAEQPGLRDEIDPVVGFLLARLHDPTEARIASLVDRVGYSHRHTIALFKRWVGLTPKQYCRIRKFQLAVHTLAGRRDVDWSDLARRCGYYDQAHFINEFRGFSGLTPANYLSACGDWVNYIPLD